MAVPSLISDLTQAWSSEVSSAEKYSGSSLYDSDVRNLSATSINGNGMGAEQVGQIGSQNII